MSLVGGVRSGHGDDCEARARLTPDRAPDGPAGLVDGRLVRPWPLGQQSLGGLQGRVRRRLATGHLPGGQGAIMATDARAELRVDVHAIEPIPEADRDSTGLQQMWIWAGANIAPINWALGALGIVLKLGLWETIAVIVLGNIVGCAIFAAFTVMRHKTGVIQMVLVS